MGLDRPVKIKSLPQRTGAPLLRPLPLKNSCNDPTVLNLNNNYGQTINNAVHAILMKHGFPETQYIDDPVGTTFRICHRYVPGDEDDTKRLTIFVTAPWASNTGTSWYKATKEIKNWADNFAHGICMPADILNSDPDAVGAGTGVGIDVEIAALELLQEKFMSLPPKNDDWLQGWPGVRDKVASILQSFVESKSNWGCISLINFGPNTSLDKNPTTVYIAMDRACDEHVMWTTIRPAIQEYIDHHTPYGWSLHMEHAISASQAFDLHALSKDLSDLFPFIITDPYEEKVNLGANISAGNYVFSVDGKKYNPIVGTMGCYVEVQFNGVWHLFGLTNYHVIRSAIPGFKRTVDAFEPEKDTPLYKADHHGFVPGTFDSQAIDSPSRTYHNATISRLQDDIPLPKDEIQQRLAFFDNGKNILGHLWAGSGFGRRTSEAGLCDWALISVNPNRVGRNILPDATKWERRVLRKHLPPPAIQGREMSSKVSPVHNVRNEPALYKFGVATQGTSGKFNAYNSKIMLKDWKYMLEEDPVTYPLCNDAMLAPLPFIQMFGSHGDSGSVVYDSKGRGAGLLFSGTQLQAGHVHFTYVSPLELIFEDIRQFLSPKVTGIRIARLEAEVPSPTKRGGKQGGGSGRGKSPQKRLRTTS